MRCFSSPASPRHCLCVQQAVSRHHSGGVASFGFLGFIACMQLPPNVSPVSASFFGHVRQGIHLVLCVACDGSSFSTSLSVCLRFSSASNSCLRSTSLSKIEGIHVQLFKYICQVTPTAGEWKVGRFLSVFDTSFLVDLEVDAPHPLVKEKGVHQSSLERR
jgi:hypothetical protein